jgi:hypothetical protein
LELRGGVFVLENGEASEHEGLVGVPSVRKGGAAIEGANGPSRLTVFSEGPLPYLDVLLGKFRIRVIVVYSIHSGGGETGAVAPST